MTELTAKDTLLLVTPEGDVTEVPNSYDGIKDTLDGRPFDFVYGAPNVGCYIDDEGLLTGLALNVPASIIMIRAVYGPIVLCRGATSDDGDTLPPDDSLRAVMTLTAERWREVVRSAVAVGQVPFAYAEADTVPLPEVISLTQEQAARFFGGEPI